ncbi:MAG: hypothetical protein HZB23_14945 [Deltaproteobacteria bacterium]|nr:hypothetical protein [Deltaproteobacteria bacterium]
MTPTSVFTITTRLTASPEKIWQRVTTPEGIAHELYPWLSMTFPKSVKALTPETVPLGKRLCRSWVLLFGVIPVDYDDVTLVELDPPRRFLEKSPMLSMAHWSHERTIAPAPGGASLTDTLTFAPRLALAAPLAKIIVKALFTHRHSRLASWFGTGR